MDLPARIEGLWDEDELDAAPIEHAIRLLDRGEVRVAEKRDGEWVVNEWTKKAILLYFRLRKVEPMEVGGLHFLDKIPVKADYAERGVRVVPPGVARYGSFLSDGVILMPGFVNIGSWVGPRTMVDTLATVGFCDITGIPRRVKFTGTGGGEVGYSRKRTPGRWSLRTGRRNCAGSPRNRVPAPGTGVPGRRGSGRPRRA